MKRLINLKTDSYDKIMSLNEGKNFIKKQTVDVASVAPYKQLIKQAIVDYYSQYDHDIEIYDMFLHGSYVTKEYGRTYEDRPGDIDVLVVGDFGGPIEEEEYGDFIRFIEEHYNDSLWMYIPEYDDYLKIDINLEHVDSAKQMRNLGVRIG